MGIGGRKSRFSGRETDRSGCGVGLGAASVPARPGAGGGLRPRRLRARARCRAAARHPERPRRYVAAAGPGGREGADARGGACEGSVRQGDRLFRDFGRAAPLCRGLSARQGAAAVALCRHARGHAGAWRTRSDPDHRVRVRPRRRGAARGAAALGRRAGRRGLCGWPVAGTAPSAARHRQAGGGRDPLGDGRGRGQRPDDRGHRQHRPRHPMLEGTEPRQPKCIAPAVRCPTRTCRRSRSTAAPQACRHWPTRSRISSARDTAGTDPQPMRITTLPVDFRSFSRASPSSTRSSGSTWLTCGCSLPSPCQRMSSARLSRSTPGRKAM